MHFDNSPLNVTHTNYEAAWHANAPDQTLSFQDTIHQGLHNIRKVLGKKSSRFLRALPSTELDNLESTEDLESLSQIMLRPVE